MSKIKKCCVFFCFFILVHSAYATKLIIGTLSHQTSPTAIEQSMFLNFELVLMKEICSRLHVECSFQPVSAHQMNQMISSGSMDIALGSIPITPNKRNQYLFSLPYQANHLQYVVLNKSRLKTIQQLAGTSIGIYLRSPIRNLALEHADNAIHVHKLPPDVDLLSALEENKLSAVLTDYHQAKQWVKDKKTIKLLGHTFTSGDGYGFITKLGRDDLIKQVNNALVDIEEDGTYLRFYNQYL